MTDTPTEAFLAPVARLALRKPALEGLVFWGGAEGWPDTPTELLEAEEIAFYAEGLLLEGFRLIWQIVALADRPDAPDHIRLLVWQDESPAPTGPTTPWALIASAEWTPP